MRQSRRKEHFKMALKSSKESGNVVFHIALNPDGTLQPIINAQLKIEDMEIHLRKIIGNTMTRIRIGWHFSVKTTIS